MGAALGLDASRGGKEAAGAVVGLGSGASAATSGEMEEPVEGPTLGAGVGVGFGASAAAGEGAEWSRVKEDMTTDAMA